jgi:hypothetical protein
MTLSKWLRVADVEDGVKPGVTSYQAAELRELNAATGCWSRRTRCCAGPRRICRRRSCRERIYPLVSELAADGIPVVVTCRVLKIARQPYYRWLEAPVTAAEWVAAHRANAIFDAHHDDPEFGYRFLADEARDAGQ